MSVMPFAPSSNSDAAEPGGPQDAVHPRERVIALQKNLEEAARECQRLQSAVVSQQQLEDLLRQGRAHLEDLRHRLLQVTADRDRLEAELSEERAARQREVDQLQTQHHDEMDGVREELGKASRERDRLVRDIAELESAHKQYAEDRADERSTFERLLAEAASNQRDMLEELNGQRQELHSLRESAIRAQSLAREIMRAHEAVAPDPDK